MNKIVALALFVGGFVLIVFGMSATDSFSSDVSRLLTGLPTNQAVWMLIAGIIAAVLGLASLSRTKTNTGKP
jgi:hypothetical protein